MTPRFSVPLAVLVVLTLTGCRTLAALGINLPQTLASRPADMTDDACWTEAEADGRAIDPAFRESHERDVYGRSVTRKGAKAQAAEFAPISVTKLAQLLDDEKWAQAVQYVRDTGAVEIEGRFYQKFDNGEVKMSTDITHCIDIFQKYFAERADCLAYPGKLECLRDVTKTRRGWDVKLCGFTYPRYEASLGDDATTVSRLEAERAEAVEAERRKRMALDLALARARETPQYRQAVIAEQLCGTQSLLAQVGTEEVRTARIDRASGTVDLTKKRQLATARLAHEDELARLVKAYAAASGKGSKAWCSEPRPDAVEAQLLKDASAKEKQASFDAQDPWLADAKAKAAKKLERSGGELIASFADIQSKTVGAVLKLRVAPAGVNIEPGIIYAEPCDARDGSIGPDGIGPSTTVEDVPTDIAEPMNAANNASFTNKAPILCYAVTAKLKKKGSLTILSFVSAAQAGQRDFDPRLDPSQGD